jgi:hypothetical protein
VRNTGRSFVALAYGLGPPTYLFLIAPSEVDVIQQVLPAFVVQRAVLVQWMLPPLSGGQQGTSVRRKPIFDLVSGKGWVGKPGVNYAKACHGENLIEYRATVAGTDWHEGWPSLR